MIVSFQLLLLYDNRMPLVFKNYQVFLSGLGGELVGLPIGSAHTALIEP